MWWLPLTLVTSAAALLVGFLAGAGRLARRRYGADTQPHERVIVPTSDGWQIALDRHLPAGPRRGVVVTCHGVGVNRFFFDLMPSRSAVRYLVGRGYEVWNVELRGSGRSRALDPRLEDAGWDFDDHVRVDVPTILEAVTLRAGVEQVHWVGHSMGGMVIMSHLGRTPDECRVATAMAIGSPFRMGGRALRYRFIGRIGMALGRLVPRFPVHLGYQRMATWAPRWPVPVYLMYPPNFEDEVFRRILYAAVEPLTGRLLGQMARMVHRGRLQGLDEEDYRGQLARIRCPTLFISGSQDLLVRPSSVKAGYDSAGSEVKEYIEIGRAQGDSGDPCHGGLMLGDIAPTDVWPRMAAWLDRFTEPSQPEPTRPAAAAAAAAEG